jgi:hypothetical protein
MELPIEWATLPNQKIIGQVSGDDETCRWGHEWGERCVT